ncbi:THO complex subunit 6-like protein, partial [Leptotrombidium deliense]
GGKGEIKGWSLPDEIEKPLWTLDIPKSEALFKPEVNALLIGEQESDPFLVAGCGDNMIHIFSLQSHKPKQTLKGHTDYVNCLALSPDSRTLYSGSEDGSIRIWDLRSASVVNLIEPHKYQVSGGGPLMSSWHLRSLSKGIEFETPPSETVANTALCHNDLVVCGGNNPYVYVWEMDGKLMSQIPTSASNVFSLAISERNEKTILTAGGASCKINVCSNFKYNDFCLTIQ